MCELFTMRRGGPPAHPAPTQAPTLSLEVGRTLNVHAATVTSLSRIGSHRIVMLCRVPAQECSFAHF